MEDKKVVTKSKVFDAKIRVQMMASLYTGDLTFNQLKEVCQCTNGNMSTHTKKLIDEEYITAIKEFVDNKPRTMFHLTHKGREEFKDYVETLQNVIKKR